MERVCFYIHISYSYIFDIYIVITTPMYIFDLWARWKQERHKPLWVEAIYFPSMTHCRFTFVYLSTTSIIYVSMLNLNSIDKNIQKHEDRHSEHDTQFDLIDSIQCYILYSVCWTTLMISDWCVTVSSAATFLMIKYQKKKNPIGRLIAIIGCILLIGNIVFLTISPLHFPQYNYNLFFFVQLCIYLCISIPLEIIYFNISLIFVFKRDSSVWYVTHY